MNEKIQRQIFNLLYKKGIKNFVGVPDSTMKYFIDEGLKKDKILITTREEEAIGIVSGMSLSNEKSLVFMQNAGFANSLSTITSLIKLYEIPMILLIGWRGFLKDDAPEHEKIGSIQTKLIKTIGIESKIINEKNFENVCDWALKKIKSGKSFELKPQLNYLGRYNPRLRTEIDGLINWEMNSYDLYNFINAFDDPYVGASTNINNKKFKRS